MQSTFGYLPAIALGGSRVYMCPGWTAHMAVYDVSTPTSPKQLCLTGAPGLYTAELDVIGSSLYAVEFSNSGGDGTIVVMDTQHIGWDPKLGTPLAMPAPSQDVQTVGSIAYVADGAGGLRVVSLANPAAPQEIGSIALPGTASAVSIQGNLAYVADGTAGLQIVDVSTPASPTLVGSIATSGNAAQDVCVLGTTAYVADGAAGLQIVDVSTPSSPQWLGTYGTPGTAMAVDVEESLAYVADGNGGLKIVNVSNSAVPALVGTYATTAYDVDVVGSVAYVAALNNHLLIIDVSNPAAPGLLAIAGVSGPVRVNVVGTLAYVSGSPGSPIISVVDISNPRSPMVVCKALMQSGIPFNCQVDGDFFFVVDDSKTNALVPVQFFSPVSSITQLSPTTFRINLATPLDAGTYYLQIGPDIATPGGSLMNQNGDATAGQGNEDVFALRFVVG
jgi:hypothetical protein